MAEIEVAWVGDGYAVSRTVDPANELVTLVKDPTGLPASHTETTLVTNDARGNRVYQVTTTPNRLWLTDITEHPRGVRKATKPGASRAIS